MLDTSSSTLPFYFHILQIENSNNVALSRASRTHAFI